MTASPSPEILFACSHEMTHMRTKEEVIEIIQSAFAPLECVAELHDYEQSVGFRVYGPDNEPTLRFKEAPIDGFLSGPGLSSIIAAARRRVEKQGHKLSPWALPPV